MARYEHLPIFVDAYKLLLQVETQVQTFSNRHRPALGADLRELSRRFVELIIATHGSQDSRGWSPVELAMQAPETLERHARRVVAPRL